MTAWREWLLPAAIVATALAVVFVLVDMLAGPTLLCRARVLGKHHVPAHTTTSVSTDAEGHTSVDTHYHPERWVVAADYDGRDIEMDVPQWRWAQVADRDVVILREHRGRWTGWRYRYTLSSGEGSP